MNGAIYKADVMGGQKTGLFYDQRPNHAFAAGWRGARACSTCFPMWVVFRWPAWRVARPRRWRSMPPRLRWRWREAGAEASGVAERFATRAGDAFDTMTALGGRGGAFDLVICDPPAFAPSKQALQQGLRAYERVARLAADLVAPGGVVMLCSCSHAADLAKFRGACLRGLGRGGAIRG
jgi:23S rRNA (cytosine1962-C5)-methyltransferase